MKIEGKNPRVAFDSQIFSDQPVGGISRYYVELARELSQLQCVPKIFAPLHINQYVASLPADLVSGHKIKSRPPKSGRLMKTLNQLIASRQIGKWTPDVVHATYYASGLASVDTTSAKAVNVVTVFDMIHERVGSRSILDNVPQLKREAVKRADHVICISHSTRKDLVEMLGTDPEKTSVVHLAADADFWRCGASTAKPLRPYLLFVGGRGTYKNFEGLLRAYASSERLKRDFDIHAFGGGAFTEQELTVAKSLEIENRIFQFHGDDSALRDAYKKAHLFVYPSKLEGFGLPPLEAMSSGCAVVSSNATSLPEVVGGAAALFDPENDDQLAALLEEVAYSDQIRDSLVAKGHVQAGLFSWRKCAVETLAVYEQTLNRRNG